MIKDKRRLRLATMAVCLAGVAALAGCADGGADVTEQKAERKVIQVRVETVEPKTFRRKLTLTGSAKASKEVTVASETPGRVVKVGFEKGDTVSKGQPLVWLDDATLKAEIAQAQAERGMTALDYRKLESLAERKASVSAFQLEQARLGLEAADARLHALATRLSKLTIAAPISGVLVTRDTEIGAIVSPGLPLARIITIKPIKVMTGIPEVAIADFSLGKEADIVLDALPGRRYRGKMSFLSPEVDRAARTFLCELDLRNEDMAILPEMSAKVTFVRRTLPGSILIPQTAIVELKDGHAVFVVEEGNVARRRHVTIDDTAEEQALVSSGLKAGETLVVLGQRGLIDGDRVVIVK